jgi:hypothetical protein
VKSAALTVRAAGPEAAGLAAIDEILATAGDRTAFSGHEVGALFHGVCVSVRDPVTCAAVRSILDTAIPANGAELVARSRVVDALLDARLLVAARSE